MSTCIIKSVFILYVLRERQSLMIFFFFLSLMFLLFVSWKNTICFVAEYRDAVKKNAINSYSKHMF